MRREQGRNQNMTSTLLKARRDVVKTIVRSFPGGRQSAAAHLGLELKKFDNQAYENNGCRSLSDDQVRKLEAITETYHLPQFIASMYGGIFVPMKSPDELDNIELYNLSIKAAAKRGRVDQIIAKALEDGVIQPVEEVEIMEEHERHLSARHEEILAVVQLHRDHH